jgi:DNA-binding response OmpR family regulator
MAATTATATATASAAVTVQTQASPRRRALVLAGDDVLREALGHWLESVGFEVVATAERDEAVVFLDQGGAELVVVDRVYPGWDGLTLQTIRKRLPSARLVVAGIAPDDHWIGLAYSVGADLVMPAPLSRQEVLTQLV